jgi:hypothetical protein
VEGIGDIKNGVLPREVPPFDWAPQPSCFSDTSGVVWMWSGNTCTVLGLNSVFPLQPFRIFPNPCDDFLNVEFDSVPTGNFRNGVFSADGNKRLSSETAGTKTTVNVHSLSAGIYFLKLSSDQLTFFRKLVKL